MTNNNCGVFLTIRYGQFGEKRKDIVVPVADELMRELQEPVELSNEPFALMLASPALYGGHGDAITIRRKKFAMRKEIARSIAASIIQPLIDAFGVNDKTDGYSKDNQ